MNQKVHCFFSTTCQDTPTTCPEFYDFAIYQDIVIEDDGNGGDLEDDVNEVGRDEGDVKE